MNVLFAAVAGIGAAVLLGLDVPGRRPRVDVLGAALVSGGMFCIVYGFSNAATHSLGHPVDVGVHRGRGAAAGRVRGLGGARAGAAAAAADRGRPDPGRGLPGDAVRRGGHVRDLAVPELLHAAAEPGLLPGDHRGGVLADGGAGHGGPAGQRGADAADRAAAADRRGHAAGRHPHNEP